MPTAASRSIFALVAAAGLPADTLSASIVSFARFFSLPLKPELMAEIRRQTLAPPDPNTAGQNREALALAAAAAEGKGIELSPKGLELFAEAIDPNGQKRQEHEKREQRNKNRNEQESQKTSPITAAALKELALESADKDPLLAILNRLPGKDGQRWIVLPFHFSENGRAFSVSLRLLLNGEHNIMSLDIAEKGEAYRRWLFVLNMAGGTIAKLTVYLQPELPPGALALFTQKLSNLLAIPPEYICVKNQGVPFPGEADGEDALLCSINEAV